MYLSAKTSQFFDHPDLYGCMFSYKTTGKQFEALESGCKWMLDNGVFTGNFILERWIKQLEKMQKYIDNCIGIVVPDVVCSFEFTYFYFYKYMNIPKKMGYPVAFVSQNGAESNIVPWNDFDVLFVGGDDRHKRGIEARELIDAAKRYNKWIHVGRVSSGNAIGKYWPDANSWDGTTYTREKRKGQQKKQYKMNKTIKNIKKGNFYLQRRLI